MEDKVSLGWTHVQEVLTAIWYSNLQYKMVHDLWDYILIPTPKKPALLVKYENSSQLKLTYKKWE